MSSQFYLKAQNHNRIASVGFTIFPENDILCPYTLFLSNDLSFSFYSHSICLSLIQSVAVVFLSLKLYGGLKLQMCSFTRLPLSLWPTHPPALTSLLLQSICVSVCMKEIYPQHSTRVWEGERDRVRQWPQKNVMETLSLHCVERLMCFWAERCMHMHVEAS